MDHSSTARCYSMCPEGRRRRLAGPGRAYGGNESRFASVQQSCGCGSQRIAVGGVKESGHAAAALIAAERRGRQPLGRTSITEAYKVTWEGTQAMGTLLLPSLTRRKSLDTRSPAKMRESSKGARILSRCFSLGKLRRHHTNKHLLRLNARYLLRQGRGHPLHVNTWQIVPYNESDRNMRQS